MLETLNKPGKHAEEVTWSVKTQVQKWTQEQVDKYGPNVDSLVPPAEVVEDEGNLLLNEGIQLMLNLLIGNTGFGNPFNNANARIGVGNDPTAAAATQTGLSAPVAPSSGVFKGMEATYPSVGTTTVTFQSKFESGEANFNWEEWTIDNNDGKNLNRKVVNLGTKQGGVWTLTVSVTLS